MNKDTKEFKAGFDCGLNGPNPTNSHFTFFATKEQTADWEAGQKEGRKAKANNQGNRKKINPRKK